MKKLVTIAAIQSKVSGDTGKNLARTEKMIRQAVVKGAQIVCLQELYRTHYFPQTRNTQHVVWRRRAEHHGSVV